MLVSDKNNWKEDVTTIIIFLKLVFLLSLYSVTVYINWCILGEAIFTVAFVIPPIFIIIFCLRSGVQYQIQPGRQKTSNLSSFSL